MNRPLAKRYTLADLRANRTTGAKSAMLTCYDYSTARLMQAAGVPMLLVGDSAASVILGHPTTLPVSLRFMIELTAAVRRGAPLALVMGDLPFGTYAGDTRLGLRAAIRMMKLSGCDCVKIEVSEGHSPLVQQLADNGVPVVAHLGLKPQSVNLLGGYKYRGRTAEEAREIVAHSLQMERSGAAAILLECVPPEVSQAIVDQTSIPVIGCGAGPACHASVVVTQDAIGMSAHRPPRFVPQLGDVGESMKESFATYVTDVASGSYPAAQHQYEMLPGERDAFLEELKVTNPE